MLKRYSQRDKKKIDCVNRSASTSTNKAWEVLICLTGVSQYRAIIQAKKWYWPLFVNCIEMLTMGVWRLHVTVQTSPHLDFLDFIRSVVAGLLKNMSSSSSGPSERRIINKIVS